MGRGKPYSMDLRERVVGRLMRAGRHGIRRRRNLAWTSTRPFSGFTVPLDGQLCTRSDGRAQAEGDFG
jgi:hypothetical protein